MGLLSSVRFLSYITGTITIWRVAAALLLWERDADIPMPSAAWGSMCSEEDIYDRTMDEMTRGLVY